MTKSKIVGIKLPSERFATRIETSQELTAYDIDNCYPERVERVIRNSGTAVSCTDILHDYLLGEGFADESVNDIVVNKKGDTMLDILDWMADDISKFNGFSLKIEYNLLLEVSEIKNLDFKYCRMGIPDSAGYIHKILYHTNWERKRGKTRDYYQKPRFYDRFNPRERVLKAQIERDKGIRNFTGQVYYWTPRKQVYPYAPLDAVLEDCESDAEAKIFKNKGIKTNFMASHIFKDPMEYESEEEEEDMKRTLTEFQGAQNAMKILWLKGFPEEVLREKANLLEKIDVQNVDQLYKYTEESVKRNIIDHLKIPQALFSKYEGNSLNQGSEIFKEASRQFNLVTRRKRMNMTKALDKLKPYFPAIADKDLTIKELYSDEEKASKQNDNSNDNNQHDEFDNQ